MKIGKVDLNKKVFIIAELSANHNQDINLAKETIKAAKEVGADAIKLQTYTPDTMTIDCKKDDFIIKGTLWDKKAFMSYINKLILLGNGIKSYLSMQKK